MLKKNLMIAAVLGLGLASGLQANKRMPNACTFTLVNDSGSDIMAKDVYNEEVHNIPVGGSANFTPSKQHMGVHHWSHHRVINIYVKQKDGTSPLT